MSSWRAKLPKWWWWMGVAIFCSIWILLLTATLLDHYYWSDFLMLPLTILLPVWPIWMCWVCPVLDARDINASWTYEPKRRLRSLRLLIWIPAGLFLFTGLMGIFLETIRDMLDGYRPQWEELQTMGLIFYAIGLVLAIWSWWLYGRVKRRLRRATLKRRICYECGYDLRGTMDAGRTSCPECGQNIPTFTGTS